MADARTRYGAAFAATAAAALMLAAAPAARAQFGGAPALRNLPADDFTWRWGDERGGRIEDFSIQAPDSGFTCMLTGELRARSRLGRSDLASIESNLRSSMSFIAAATEAMNGLERQRDLDWAVLDCEKIADDER